MMDYSEYLLRINRLMQETHKAAQANNYEIASDMSAEVARYAISLAAYFESKLDGPFFLFGMQRRSEPESR